MATELSDRILNWKEVCPPQRDLERLAAQVRLTSPRPLRYPKLRDSF
jgi:hypothetical protein